MDNLEKPTVKLTALLVVAEYHLLRYVVFAKFVVWGENKWQMGVRFLTLQWSVWRWKEERMEGDRKGVI